MVRYQTPRHVYKNRHTFVMVSPSWLLHQLPQFFLAGAGLVVEVASATAPDALGLESTGT